MVVLYNAWQGVVGLGTARSGEVWQGEVGRGMAGYGKGGG